MCGSTGNGKTYFAKCALNQIAKESVAEIIIYSPVDFEGWHRGIKIYSDIAKFVEAIESYKKSDKKNCHIYIDEFSSLNTHYRHFNCFPKTLKELTTMSRHYGITAWIASQRPYQVHPEIRNNCSEIICFYLVGERDRKIIQELSSIKEYKNKPLQNAISELQKLEAFIIKPTTRTLLKKTIE